ncbi:MAG: hypothetical protein EPO26_08140 [Chloroflexota bacterium]|nr:MAG: hypothetical protein EPO26_08140 [Chloroflexota bacterium]
MPYCPRCRSEYNVGVESCIDCHVPLVLLRPVRPALFDFDLDELMVPLGALFCLLGAVALFGVTILARDGKLDEPIGSMIAAQPVCMTVFYGIAAILSAVVLIVALLRWLVFRR